MKVKAVLKKNIPLEITTPFISLDSALKFSGVVETGGQAKILVEEGLVSVNGEICSVKRKKLYNGDKFKVENTIYEVVSK